MQRIDEIRRQLPDPKAGGAEAQPLYEQALKKLQIYHNPDDPGTLTTMTPGEKSNRPFSRSALWLCSRCSHQ